MHLPAGRRKSTFILAASAAVLLGFFKSTPQAGADQYFDGLNANPAAVEGGTGPWDNTITTNWTNAAGTTNTFYDPTQTAIFGITGGTVTLGENITFTNLRFEANNYQINPDGGGLLTLTPTGTAVLNALSGFTATINPIITGAGGLNLTGPGTIVLANSGNDYTGGTILANGSLIVGTGALGNASKTLTITATGGPVLLGSNANGTTIENPIAVKADFSVATTGFAQDFTLNGAVDLNGATRAITGVTLGGQVHFGTGGIISTGGTGGLTLNTTAVVSGDYVSFIFDPGNVNTYTGLTTLNNGAFAVFEGSTANGAIKGDVLVQGNGVVDYLSGASEQIADTATVTVNSPGNSASGIFFSGLDLFNATGTETIGTLNGDINGTVGLNHAILAVGAGDFSGSISDGTHGFVGGNLTKYGPGTLTLRGVNTFTGVTTINGGTLVMAGSTISPVTVNNGSEFDVDAGGLVTPGGVGAAVTVNGTGNTVKNSGEIIRTKAVDLSGVAVAGHNDVVNLGTMTGTGGTAIDASTSLASVTVTNAGTINGSVLLSAQNDTLTVATGSTITGTISPNGGSDTLRLVGGGTDTADLARYGGFTYLNKLGGGTWTLTGTGTFSGGTTVQMGNLYVQGNLISNVQVLSEGLLGGRGVITGNVFNAGTVNPGNSPGTITIKGSYTQNRSGTLVIQIAGKSPAQHDLLAVQGQARLDGTLRIEKLNKGPRLKIGERVTFLTADNGVSGKFSEVVNPLAGDSIIKTEVVYDNHSVALAGAQGSYAEFASRQGLTPNQRAAAEAVDAAAFGGKDKKMVEYLNNRPLNKLPGDLNRVAPEELASAYRVGVALADVQARNVEQRMDELRLSSRRPKTAVPTAGSGQPGAGGVAGPAGADGKSVAIATPQDRWGVFFTGIGEVTKVGRTENARGYDMTTGGITVGLDYLVTPNFAIGMSVGYANTGANLVNDGKLLINGGKLGAYATYFTGGFHADAAVSSGFNSYETRRSALNGTARGQTDGLEFSALAGAGYDWKFDDFTLGPTATLQYTYVGIDEFTEHGSLSPLRVVSQHEESIRSTLGYKAAYDWILGRVIVRPEIRMAWQHEYGDRSFSIDSELVSGAGGLFRVEDAETGRDSFLLSAGVSVLWSPSTLLYLSYDGELGRKEYEAHNLSGGMRLSF